ncbi:MAG: family 10 glycosylhydrolase [Eggerthellaceae bacterium]|nr:family 10 glycosylhydrolase [Eggerthellaceae bacterium]
MEENRARTPKKQQQPQQQERRQLVKSPMAKNRRVLVVALVVAFVLIAAGALAAAFMMKNKPSQGESSQTALPLSDTLAPEQPANTPTETGAYKAIPLPEEMRAMWISFQELQYLDFSSEEAARNDLGQMFEECAGLGLNTVIVMVHPYSDALYRSALFPFSHIISGTQGLDPGFDPLAIMVHEAHVRNLRIEAWMIPYKVSQSWAGPHSLSADNPAIIHPEWVVDIDGDLWYDPGIPEVRDLVRAGVLEIVENYEVDGIHFDDYFCPDSSEGSNTFDADSYAAFGGGESLADWRRGNNDKLVKAVYEGIKSRNPSVSFGISPQGNNNVNYSQEYSDVKKWMTTEGYIDYIMPQLYWGFNYRTADGSAAFAFENIVAEWASYPRHSSVKLYAGLGAYRIGLAQGGGSRFGFGDYGENDQSEWESGRNLADMVVSLRQENGYAGFALFRHDYVFQSEDWLSQSECAALKEVLG